MPCKRNLNLLFVSVFYMRALFDTGLDQAVLESSQYDINEPVCIKFRYQISTPKIKLSFNASTNVGPNFYVYVTWTFADQHVLGGWNDAFVSLPNGVTKWSFIAEKNGFTSNSPYAALDHIEFVSSCPYPNSNSGEHASQ